MKTKLFRKSILTGALATALAGFGMAAPVAYAADEAADDDSETVVIIGSRSQKTRTVADSPVPIDVISAADLTAMGGTADLTDNLKALIPSYTATPATGDGSAFVRPTSLRGTASDQTLVLVNGKRRHRSSLVQFFAPAAGAGAHGVDIGMIPSIALKRVEVLRDGAASQYGSDAIAGVINFVTKDSAEGGEVQVQYGQYYEGEQSVKFGINQGIGLGDNGFLNFSLEYTDNEALSRGFQRAAGQSLIDAGVQGVGADSPFGDGLVQTWGRPETSGLRTFTNAGIEFDNGNTLYAQLGYSQTDGRYRFFYRAPGHSTLNAAAAGGYTGSLLDTGFTPYLDGAQTDLSFSTGFKGDMGDTFFDISVSYGENELDYFLNNTLNGSLPLNGTEIAQMDFDVGAYTQEEVGVNADFSTPVGDNLNVAYGAEWREETYIVTAGEANASLGGGSSGFKGILPADAGSFARDNYAVYLDIEHDISSDLMIQYAGRYEDFSDFGDTFNGKVAGRYNITDVLALRGAVSTGFHAPTPGQANVQTTLTTFDGATGLQVEESLITSNDPRYASIGGIPLTEEKSFNISFGFTADIGESTTLTVDLYQIAVDDRIYRTGNITDPNDANASLSYYTNAMDVEHSGVDIVLSSDIEWNDSVNTDVSWAFSFNKIDVVDQKEIITSNGQIITPVSDALVEDIENNYPSTRFVLSTNTHFNDDFNLMIRANYYGQHYDERGRINDTTSPTALIGSTVYMDAELGYQVNDAMRLKVGFTNLLDNYVDQIGEPNANRRSVGLQYPRRSAANYEGGSWYAGFNYIY